MILSFRDSKPWFRGDVSGSPEVKHTYSTHAIGDIIINSPLGITATTPNKAGRESGVTVCSEGGLESHSSGEVALPATSKH